MAAKSELVIHSTERAPGAELTGIYYCHYRENCHFQTFDLELLKSIYYTKNYIKIPMTQKHIYYMAKIITKKTLPNFYSDKSHFKVLF